MSDSLEQSVYRGTEQTIPPPSSVSRAALDHTPILVTPDTPIIEALMLMSQGSHSCVLPPVPSVAHPSSTLKRVSCVLVMVGKQLVGILTERDIVKLTAQGTNLTTTTVADVMTQRLITLKESALTNPFVALEVFRQHRIRHLPVLNKKGHVIGVMTPASLRQILQSSDLLKLRRVVEVMSTDVIQAYPTTTVMELAQLMVNHQVSCVVIVAENPREQESEAGKKTIGASQFQLSREAELHLGDAMPKEATAPSDIDLDFQRSQYQTPGRSSDDHFPIPVGIITERDIVQFHVLELTLTALQARDVMSAPLVCLQPESTLWQAHQMMQQMRVRRLVVAYGQGGLAGILTQTSVLSALDPVEMHGAIEILQLQVKQLRDEKVELLQTLNVGLENQVRASEQSFQAMFEQAAVGIALVGLDGRFRQVNQRFCNMVGYSQADLLNKLFVDITHPEEQSLAWRLVEQLIRDEIPPFSLEKRYCRQDGSIMWGNVTVSLVTQPSEKSNYLLAIVEDISDRKRMAIELEQHRHHLEELVTARTAKLRKSEEALFREKERAQVTLHSIGDAVITTDADGRVEYLNPIAEQLTGWKSGAAKGRFLSAVFQIVHEVTREPVKNPVERGLHSGCPTGLANHTILISQDGTEYSIEDSAAPIFDRANQMIGVVIVFHDVTQSRRLARQLSWQARHDDLTRLVNRRQFEHDLAAALREVKQENQQHVLCYLDLDQFKVVNDTCGHIAGDELLRQVSRILQAQIRATDTLARLGGDEFGVLLKQCPLDQAEVIANDLRRAIQDLRFIWKDKAFCIGVSIGLVRLANTDSSVLTDILSAADAACYAAKDRGRNRVHVYQANDSELARQRRERQWSVRIKQMLAANRFCLYRQAISSTTAPKNSQNSHYEILIRMLDEDGELILPGSFIPAAERYDLMPDIDRWVIRTVFSYIEQTALMTLTRRTTQPPLHMINLSGASISDDQFLSFLKEQFERYSVSPQTVGFEITETAAIANLDQAIYLMRELKQLGCRFALDDFGSGMSSFAYLKTLPVDYLKIDGEFVEGMADDPTTCAIVESINHIGHVMGLKTIAESVENAVLRTQLEKIGLDYVQGYGVAMPTHWV